jgi:hypothetical protein
MVIFIINHTMKKIKAKRKIVLVTEQQVKRLLKKVINENKNVSR